jgi:hypothetical protein
MNESSITRYYADFNDIEEFIDLIFIVIKQAYMQG